LINKYSLLLLWLKYVRVTKLYRHEQRNGLLTCVRRRRCIAVPLQQVHVVTNRTIFPVHKLPAHGSLVVNGQLGETVVYLVKVRSNVLLLLTIGKSAVAFDIACHAIDEMGEGLAGVCVVCVVVNNGTVVDNTLLCEWEQTLVPVDVTSYTMSVKKKKKGLVKNEKLTLRCRGQLRTPREDPAMHSGHWSCTKRRPKSTLVDGSLQ
jgi:hypothetical protein